MFTVNKMTNEQYLYTGMYHFSNEILIILKIQTV